ncbi:MAG: nuclear transport factor 2 family protein [Kofleriaceae bacterium]
MAAAPSTTTMNDVPSPEAVVREFWRRMATNDFFAVTQLLADDLVVEWPQSGERFRGATTFARVNAAYPTNGRWRFSLNQLVASGDQVVTQVSLTDGHQPAEPISFFTVRDGRIVHLREYWPEPFAPAAWRHALADPVG